MPESSAALRNAMAPKAPTVLLLYQMLFCLQTHCHNPFMMKIAVTASKYTHLCLGSSSPVSDTPARKEEQHC